MAISEALGKNVEWNNETCSVYILDKNDINEEEKTNMSDVYFTKNISSEAVMKIYKRLDAELQGKVAGILSKTKMPVIAKVLIAQAAGRIIRAAAILCAIYLFGNRLLNISQTWNVVLTGLPGIILQLCILPLLMYRIKNSHE